VTVALDSNVFIAYLAKEAAFYDSAKLIIGQIADSKMGAVCSSIVFGELMYAARKPESLAAVDNFFEQLVHCVDMPASKAICRRAAALQLTHPGLKLPNAIHLATAIEAKADNFITADKRLLTIAKRLLPATYLNDFRRI
jgi:predicted nucleic acid-binding protein